MFQFQSTENNAKLLQQLKSGFKRTINWGKYKSSIKNSDKDRYFNYLVDPKFQGANRLFALPFENEDNRTSHSTYYLLKVEIQDYNVMNDGKNFFNQPINSDFKTNENVRRTATGQRYEYTAGFLLDCSYFKENYRMIAIDLSKQQALDAGPRAIQ